MDTKAKLENALKEAMRAGDEVKKRTVRMALAAIKQPAHRYRREAIRNGHRHYTQALAEARQWVAGFSQVLPEELVLSWQSWLLTLGDGSVAIDAGDNATCTAVDQRGWPRPWDGDENETATCDVGAHEFVSNMKYLYLPMVRK